MPPYSVFLEAVNLLVWLSTLYLLFLLRSKGSCVQQYATLEIMIGAVDIGGTKTLVAVFNSHGEIVEEQRILTNQDYDIFLSDLREVVNNLTTKDFAKVAVAVPGRLDRQEGMALGYGTLQWKPEPIVADLEPIFHCPVLIENDAKLAGLYEANNIKHDFKNVLYVTIGTGISCALITDGNIDPALEDSEGGQILVDFGGRPKQWEDVASGKAIVRRFGKKAAEITDDSAWKRISHDISLGLLSLIAVTQPEVIVMGGGVNTNFEKYIDYLKKELKKYETPLVPIPPIRKAKRPEEAVIYGCYELTKAHHANTH